MHPALLFIDALNWLERSKAGTVILVIIVTIVLGAMTFDIYQTATTERKPIYTEHRLEVGEDIGNGIRYASFLNNTITMSETTSGGMFGWGNTQYMQYNYIQHMNLHVGYTTLLNVTIWPTSGSMFYWQEGY